MGRIIESTTQGESIDKDDLFHKIRPLGRWISKELGMRDVIDEMTLPHRTPPPQKQLDKFYKGIEILERTSMPLNFIRTQKNRSKDMMLVYNEKGKWDYVNKLNTNYSDTALLLAELIVRIFNDNPVKGLEAYKEILQNPKLGLLKLKPIMSELFKKHFTFTDLQASVNEIKKFSKRGEEAEETVIEWLEYLGYEIAYTGGNGDMIDMLFGTDIIVRTPDHKYFTIQVKKSKMDLNELDYLHVDWIVFVEPVISVYNKVSGVEIPEHELMV